MAIKPILKIDEPILRRKTKRVNKIDRSILQLIQDLTDTLEKADGVGLAAPQIGSSWRVSVLWLPDEEPYAIINPEIVKRIGEREIEEGCLSLPGYQSRIKRAVSVTVKCLGIDGAPMKIRATELLAQALEHEIDHLDGILYTDHIEGTNKLYKVEERAQTSHDNPLVINQPSQANLAQASASGEKEETNVSN
ncbi:MAG: peptide deformylase [Dehalococcoidia bacterium]|nr:peptide deformylase [Dehalococcoidia bacterium]